LMISWDSLDDDGNPLPEYQEAYRVCATPATLN
jgi:hypothetical protein